jgi:hypothetical protein
MDGHNKRKEKKSQGHQQERREDSTPPRKERNLFHLEKKGTSFVLVSPAVCDLDTSWSRAMRGVYCCKCSKEKLFFKREVSCALVQIVAIWVTWVATTFDDGVLEEMVP